MTEIMSQRRAGTAQGIVMLFAAILPVMGVVLISPIAPALQAAFAHEPGGKYLAAAALTAPALAIAFFSPIVGALVDRIGSRRVLMAAMILYAPVGMAPIWIDNIYVILVARLLLGVAEAAIMTAMFTMVAAYFEGQERIKWVSYKASAAGLGATVFYLMGGFLGEISWRAPFAAYGASLIIALAAYKYLYEPGRPTASDGSGSEPEAAKHPLPIVLGLCLLTCIGAIFFYIVPIQFALLLLDGGVQSPASLGMLIAIAGLGYPLGAVAFRFFGKVPVPVAMAIAGAATAFGLFLATSSTSVAVMVAGAFVHQVGSGAFVPIFQLALLRILPPGHRGLGGGGWATAFFTGQFLCPLLVTAAIDLSGALRSGLMLLTAGIAIFTIASVIMLRLSLKPATLPSTGRDAAVSAATGGARP